MGSSNNENEAFIVDALNKAHGTELDTGFYRRLGLETLRDEWEFNRQAGFTEEDDKLPDFFHDEGLPPTGKQAHHGSAAVNAHLRALLA